MKLLSCSDKTEKPAIIEAVPSTAEIVKTDMAEVQNGNNSPQSVNKEQKFTVAVSKQNADLNRDGIEDLITVAQDTVDPKNPYLLQIHLSQSNGKMKLMLSSDSAIVVPYPYGKARQVNDAMFTGIKIKNGTFVISHEFTRGSFSHQFRFQNDKFELIGYRSAGISGRDVEEVDFNLSTGDKTVTRLPIGSDKIMSTEKTKQVIRPLPDLQFFEPYRYDF